MCENGNFWTCHIYSQYKMTAECVWTALKKYRINLVWPKIHSTLEGAHTKEKERAAGWRAGASATC